MLWRRQELAAYHSKGYYCDAKQWSGHGNIVDTDSLIPIILAGRPLVGSGRTVASANQVDIAATIADVLGFPVQSDGHSFLTVAGAR